MEKELSIIKEIENLVLKFSENELSLITKLKDQTDRLDDICRDIHKSWSGSTLGYHGSFYYGDLTPPPVNNRWSSEWGTMNGTPSNWNSWEGDEIKKIIEDRMGNDFEVKKYTSEIKSFEKKIVTLKTDILIELSQINWEGNLTKEKKIYSEIETFDFGDTDKLYADFINPYLGKVISRDMAAMTEGRYIPNHLTIQANAYGLNVVLENVENFVELMSRFVRQANKSLDAKPTVVVPKIDSILILEKIFKKFHPTVARLKLRHADRQTLEINDEYDVQDFLHTLLTVDFDDIRPEEWTPSYAGSATRVDFLLKKEKIVVEVKITSPKTKDKEIGEQLILDIAHYKKHPECKTLVCFVYDPLLKIKNREGLINDIEGNGGELPVKVYIYP